MEFAQQLKNELESYNLLKHKFYQLWNEGKLNKEILSQYATEYFYHVENFPRCLSAIHSLCDSKEDRAIILENLLEEESNTSNHPELWLAFAKRLGVYYNEIKAANLHFNTKNLINTFTNRCRSSYEEGIGALYAQEWQYSKIAETKKAGLKEFYDISEDDALKFFSVHSEVDVWHAEQLTTLLNRLPEEKKASVREGAVSAAKALWGFLDGMLEQHEGACCHA